MRQSISDFIRMQAVVAMMHKDAGALQFLKDLFKAIREISSGSEEDIRIQEYIKKNPTVMTKLEEMAEIFPSVKPLVRKMLAAVGYKYSGLKDIGRKIKRFFQYEDPESWVEKPEPKPQKKTPPAPEEKPQEKEPAPEEKKPEPAPVEKKPEPVAPETEKSSPTEKEPAPATPAEPSLDAPENAAIKETWTDKGVSISNITRKGPIVTLSGSLRRPLQVISSGRNVNKGVNRLRVKPKGFVEISIRQAYKKALYDMVTEVMSRFDPTQENIEKALKEETPEGKRRFEHIEKYFDYKKEKEMEQKLKTQNPDQVADSLLISMVKSTVASYGIQAGRVERRGDSALFMVDGTVSDDIDVIVNGRPANKNIFQLVVNNGGGINAYVNLPDLVEQTEQKVEEKAEEMGKAEPKAPAKPKAPRMMKPKAPAAPAPSGAPAAPKPGAPAAPKPRAPKPAPAQKPMTQVIREQRQKGIGFDA